MQESARATQLRYPLKEEIANSITHGIGAIAAIAGLFILVSKAVTTGSAWYVVSFAVFGVSALLLYTMSTLYHALSAPRAKRVFKVLDHSSIYVLIAGTYTPFALLPLRPSVGWWIFGLVWGFAVIGVALKPFLAGKAKFLSTIGYVAMGWIVVLAWKPLTASVSKQTITFLMAGGAAYTLGAAVYLVKGKSWSHPLWHIFVGAGTVFHFLSVMSLLPA
ncbi:MAG TPA: hemolysin III family protein [Spirochaetales bacterium]|nr:hemolysin III family protein [Spirochaetales bacterium]